MKKIQNFEEFVNESYLQDIGKKISAWSKGFKDALKSGLVRLIKSGPKAGKPAFILFSGEDGSIQSQVDRFFAGTEWANMDSLTNPTLSEAEDKDGAISLNWPVPGDIPDVNVGELKDEIKMRVRDLFETVEMEKDLPEDERKGVFDVKPMFIFGAPGIGKTQIVSQVCDELGKELYRKPLNLFFIDGETAEPVDFAGVPSVINIEEPSVESPFGTGVTRMNPSINMLPQDNGPGGMGGIIFIDELNRMPDAVINIFMKLAQSRRVGQAYKVPEKWYIIAAGNRKVDDPAKVKDLGKALAERFDKFNYVPDIKSFRKYIETGRLKDVVIPELLDFLEFMPGFFHKMTPGTKKIAAPTPRGWTDAAFNIRRLEKESVRKGEPISDKSLSRAISAAVGAEAANEFIKFYKLAKQIPVKDIILPYTDPERAPSPIKSGDLSYTYALIGAVVRKSQDVDLDVPKVCNLMKWIAKHTTGTSADWGAAALSKFIQLNPWVRNDAKAVQCIAPVADKFEEEIGIEL
jgi:hypothetical protein